MSNYVLNAQISNEGFALLLTTKANGFNENLRNMITSMGGHRRNALKMQGVNTASMLQDKDLVAVNDPEIFQIQGVSIIDETDDLLTPAQKKRELELLKTFKSEIIKIKAVTSTLASLDEALSISFMDKLIALKKLDSLEATSELSDIIKARIETLITELSQDVLKTLNHAQTNSLFVQELKEFSFKIAKNHHIDLPENVALTFSMAEKKALFLEQKNTLILALSMSIEQSSLTEDEIEKLQNLIKHLEDDSDALDPAILKTLINDLNDILPPTTLRALEGLQIQLIQSILPSHNEDLIQSLQDLLGIEDLDEQTQQLLIPLLDQLKGEEISLTSPTLQKLLENLETVAPIDILEKIEKLQFLQQEHKDLVSSHIDDLNATFIYLSHNSEIPQETILETKHALMSLNEDMARITTPSNLGTLLQEHERILNTLIEETPSLNKSLSHYATQASLTEPQSLNNDATINGVNNITHSQQASVVSDPKQDNEITTLKGKEISQQENIREEKATPNDISDMSQTCQGVCVCDDFKQAVSNLENGTLQGEALDKTVKELGAQHYGLENIADMSNQEIIQKLKQEIEKSPILPENLTSLSKQDEIKIVSQIADNAFNGNQEIAKQHFDDVKNLQNLQQQREAEQAQAKQQRDDARRKARQEAQQKKTDTAKNKFNLCAIHGHDCSPELHNSNNTGQKVNISDIKTQKPSRKRGLKIKD